MLSRLFCVLPGFRSKEKKKKKNPTYPLSVIASARKMNLFKQCELLNFFSLKKITSIILFKKKKKKKIYIFLISENCVMIVLYYCFDSCIKYTTGRTHFFFSFNQKGFYLSCCVSFSLKNKNKHRFSDLVNFITPSNVTETTFIKGK